MMGRKRQKLVHAAEKLVQRGKLLEAIDKYRKVLAERPNDTSTLNRVGDLYARLKRLKDATDLFSQTADHFVAEGFVVKAIAILKKIVRLDPTHIESQEKLADLYYRQGLSTEARTQYQLVADHYQEQGDLVKAIATHKKIVEVEPSDPSHRLHLAELHWQEGRKADAHDQFAAIARLMLEADHLDDVEGLCLKVLALDPGDLRFLLTVVGYLEDRGFDDAVQQLVQQAGEINAAALAVVEAASASSDLESAEDVAPEPEILSPDLPFVVEGPGEESSSAERGEAGSELESFGEDEDTVIILDLGDDGPEIDGDFEIDFDFSESELSPETVKVPTPVDFEQETTPYEPPVEETPAGDGGDLSRADELLNEAEVLARYGLEDKAREGLEKVLSEDPNHLEGHVRLIGHLLERGEMDEARILGSRMARLAQEAGQPEAWRKVADALRKAGVRVPSVPSAPAPATPSVDPGGNEVSGSHLTTPSESQLTAAREQFFDLASELEAELSEEDGEDLIPLQQEQSLEEIVEGFKEGMEQTLSEDDYDTHFNLGIAYREMELVDEAIGEFQLASKDPRYLIESCSHLASCFVAKGYPELAMKWYQRGLEAPGISEQESLGLSYELAEVHLTVGNKEAAREKLIEVYGANSNYRDVAAKLEELGGHE